MTDEPLIQSDLADRAGVSVRSVRTHTERLHAFDFVRGTDDGWRFALPFHTDEERGEDIRPWFVATSADDSEADETFVRDVLDDVVCNLLDVDRYADPEDPVGGALFGPPGELIPALREAWEWIEPWIRMVRTLLDAPNSPPPGRTIATVGIEPKQASLTAATGGG